MVFGLTLSTYTLIHVLISLAGIVSGLVFVFGLIGGRKEGGWATTFLVTTLLTSVTGFGFPFERLLPSHIFGIISLIALSLAILASSLFNLKGAWSKAYVIGSVLALYLNMFVLVVQSFQKVPFLNALAPTQSEPPFAITQAIVLGLLVVFGIKATKNFHPVPGRV